MKQSLYEKTTITHTKPQGRHYNYELYKLTNQSILIIQYKEIMKISEPFPLYNQDPVALKCFLDLFVLCFVWCVACSYRRI